MAKHKKISILILMAFSCFFMLIFYQKVIIHPNHYLFSNWGDGTKNYFTYVSQVRTGSCINSHIMNYPYGENFLYLDCHPIFTIILHSISRYFPSVTNYSIGIINFLMIFSFVLTSLFVFLILIEQKVNPCLSAAGAFSITVLAPQIFRLTAHCALSYSFFIPLSWFLFLKFWKSDFKIKWSVIIGINILFWFLVHAYLGMIIIAFLLLNHLFYFFIFARNRIFKIAPWTHIFVQLIAPAALFWIFSKLTDTHIGRTTNPYGFFIFNASIKSVFLPQIGFLYQTLNRYFDITCSMMEGWAYVGFGSIAVILVFLFYIISRIFTKRTFIDGDKLANNKLLLITLLSGIILLLFSMGYPFKWGMKFLIDLFPIIKNFRATGRFAWIFYYVITIFCVYFMSLVFEYSKKRKKFALFLFLLLPLSYVFEGYVYHKQKKEILTQCPNLFDKKQLPETYQQGLQIINNIACQAIVPLPFYHTASETFTKFGTNKIYNLSMILSYHSQLPILGNYSTRTSIPESKKIIQILSPGFYQKEIETDIKSDKPFVIIYSQETLSEYEQLILDRSTKLYSNGEFSIYSIQKSRLFENNAIEEIKYFKTIQSKLIYKHGFLTTDSTSVILFNSFDDLTQDIVYRGKGSYKGQKDEYNILEIIDGNSLKADIDYIISFWMYNGGENFGQDALVSSLLVDEVEESDNFKTVASGEPHTSYIINGDWSLIELPFRISNSLNKVRISLRDYNYTKKIFYIDDFLIREKDVTIYKILKEDNSEIIELFKNNHWIKI